MKVSLYLAMSLDGFLARENGDLDWLPTPSGEAAEDYGYASFVATVDTIVMGRHTFEKVLSFGGEWFYQLPVVVLTSKPNVVPDEYSDRVTSTA